jgi:hypothetical protein
MVLNEFYSHGNKRMQEAILVMSCISWSTVRFFPHTGNLFMAEDDALPTFSLLWMCAMPDACALRSHLDGKSREHQNEHSELTLGCLHLYRLQGLLGPLVVASTLWEGNYTDWEMTWRDRGQP